MFFDKNEREGLLVKVSVEKQKKWNSHNNRYGYSTFL